MKNNSKHSAFKSLLTPITIHHLCKTKHILPYNFNICYRIYLNFTEINGIGMPDAIMINETIEIFQQELVSLIIILPLFYMGKLQLSQ